MVDWSSSKLLVVLHTNEADSEDEGPDEWREPTNTEDDSEEATEAGKHDLSLWSFALGDWLCNGLIPDSTPAVVIRVDETNVSIHNSCGGLCHFVGGQTPVVKHHREDIVDVENGQDWQCTPQ